MPICRLMQWHPIPEAIDMKRGNFYAVNETGGVAEITMASKFIRHIPQREDGRGYLCCDIKINGRWRTKKVHHLVMQSFKGPTPKGYHIDHKDKDKTNNAITNLRWRKAGDNSSDCRRGSRKGSRRLCSSTRTAITDLIQEGWTTKALATAFDVGESTIRRIRKELN